MSRSDPRFPPQKVLDNHGIVDTSPTGALAHLGLARAYALAKDTDKAASIGVSSPFDALPAFNGIVI